MVDRAWPPSYVPICCDLLLNHHTDSSSSSPLAAHTAQNHSQLSAFPSFDELRLCLLILDLSLLPQEDSKKAASTSHTNHAPFPIAAGTTPATLCPLLGDAVDSLMPSPVQGSAPTPCRRTVGGRASGDAVTGRLTWHPGSLVLLGASHTAAAGLRYPPASPRPGGNTTGSTSTSDLAGDRPHECSCSTGASCSIPVLARSAITRGPSPHWVRGVARELWDACLMFNTPGSW